MWKSRFFWKLFLSSSVLIVLAVGACATIVAGWQEEQLVEQVSRRLRDSAELLRASVERDFPHSLDKEMQQRLLALGEATATRFTLIDAEGLVLAESEQPSLEEVATMENHIERPEFVEARRSGAGLDQRRSATLGVPFLYYALAIQRDGRVVGYVRAAEAVTVVEEQADAIRRLIFWLGAGVTLSCLAIAYWLTKRILNPVQALTNAAENMAAGIYPKRIRVASGDELGTLARSFEMMSEKLDSRERELREIATRQATVLGGMLEGVLAIDAQQRVLFANSAAGRSFGFAAEDVQGRSLLEVVRSNDLRHVVQKALRSGKLCSGEIEWSVRGKRTFEVTATPLPGSPCPGVVVVLHDVSQLKRLENLRQQFVANVSHELKTPLSSIKAYTETLLGGALEDKQNARRFLSRIEDQAERLHGLIIDMLSLTRIESGQAVTELADVKLSAVVTRCLADHEARAAAQEIELVSEPSPSPVEVRADEEGLQQILGNLIDNAIKYTPSGGKVSVRCRTEERFAVIEVADTGPGISPEHHERLFERFYRVDKARSRELGGTGLGLSIVKHLCQAMGGNVSVESALGQGSTFRVRLPLASSEPALAG